MPMLEDIGNSVAIITGALQVVRAIHRSIEAVQDVSQQTLHLAAICRTICSSLNHVETTLQQNRLRRQQQQQVGGEDDDQQAASLQPIYDLIDSMRPDLEHIQETIESEVDAQRSPSRLIKKLKQLDLVRAPKLKFNLNMKAVDRITRSSHALAFAVELWKYETIQSQYEAIQSQSDEILDGVRDLMGRVATGDNLTVSSARRPSTAHFAAESQADSQLQTRIIAMKQWIFDQARQLTIRNIQSQSPTPQTQSRPATPSFLDCERQRPLQIERIASPRELQKRYEEHMRLTRQAIDRKLHDAAVAFHARAMAVKKQLACPVEFPDHVDMEAYHIRLQLNCLEPSKRKDGLKSLDDLAAVIDGLASSRSPEWLFKARVEIGNIYYDARKYMTASKYLGDALEEGEVLNRPGEHRDEIRDLVQTIYNAERRGGSYGNHRSFHDYIKERLLYDPLGEPSQDQELFAFLQRWRFPSVSQESSIEELRDSQGNTPLHRAVECDNPDTEIVRRLSANPTVLNLVNSRGLTPLFVAVEAKNLEAVRILLEDGASLDIVKQSTDLSETILHCCKDAAIMALLLRHLPSMEASAEGEGTAPVAERVTIDTMSFDLLTALHVACREKNYEVAKVLIDHGADVNARGFNGQTPLMMACYGDGDSRRSSQAKIKTKSVVELLVQAGSDTEVIDNLGRTASKGLKGSGFLRGEWEAMLSPQGRAMSYDSGIGGSPSPSLRHRLH
jgi:tetratricopeptide (TPR) repeat protein